MPHVNHNPRTMRRLEGRGYTCQVVESWNSFARVRQDLFGILDILAVGQGRTLGVQVTSRTNVSSRVRKILDSPVLPELLAAGWTVEVWGWEKVKNRWVLGRVVDVGEHSDTPHLPSKE